MNDYDELAVVDDLELEFTYVPSCCDDQDARRAKYAEKLNDELALWLDYEVQEALECGAITQEQADAMLADADPEEDGEEDGEEEVVAPTEEEKNAFYERLMTEDWVPDMVGGIELGSFVRRGTLTQEQAGRVAQRIDDYYKELAAEKEAAEKAA